MPPSIARAYLIGRCGSYEIPTVGRIDGHLQHLRRLLRGAHPASWPRIRWDVDQLLDARLRLMKELT